MQEKDNSSVDWWFLIYWLSNNQTQSQSSNWWVEVIKPINIFKLSPWIGATLGQISFASLVEAKRSGTFFVKLFVLRSYFQKSLYFKTCIFTLLSINLFILFGTPKPPKDLEQKDNKAKHCSFLIGRQIGPGPNCLNLCHIGSRTKRQKTQKYILFG